MNWIKKEIKPATSNNNNNIDDQINRAIEFENDLIVKYYKNLVHYKRKITITFNCLLHNLIYFLFEMQMMEKRNEWHNRSKRKQSLNIANWEWQPKAVRKAAILLAYLVIPALLYR